MKIKMILLISLTFLTVHAQAGQDRGGGNILGEKMIESYIVDPASFADGKIFAERLQYIKEKNIDLYALISKGLKRPTWYFIPGKLKELSQSITGIPFETEQVAIQNLDTNEVWVDETLYNSGENGLIDNNERQKLLIHEALIGGLNTSFIQVIGVGLSSIFDSNFTMPKFKKIIRSTVNLIFSADFSTMTKEQITDQLSGIGWSVKDDESIICLKYDTGKTEPSGTRIYDSVRCSEVDSYSRALRK